MSTETVLQSLSPQQTTPDDEVGLGLAASVVARLRSRLRAQIMGRDEVIDLVIAALLADGHILLEDYPGSGKTTLAKGLGDAISSTRSDDEIAAFRRLQFTPDLLPADITGVMVFDGSRHVFEFRRGPVFAHVLLVDEINRTSPKVQSALLEAMAEKQVTVDNTSHVLDELFFVIATQNPRDVAGTFPLPLAQLDRFLFKIGMKAIGREAELEVLERWGLPHEPIALPGVSRDEVIAARRAIRSSVAIHPGIKAALVDTAANLRERREVLQGVSTRALVQAISALQALAAIAGRDYVSTADLDYLLPRLFGHRIECLAGTDDLDAVIRSAAEEPLEALTRQTIRP